MRLASISIRDAPPIRRFEANNLGSRILIAGPNGIGKSVLINLLATHFQGGALPAGSEIIIEPTTPAESEFWGKDSLSSSADAPKLAAYLQRNRRRTNWSGSVILFRSDRAIQNIAPLQFQWDSPDPDEEEVSWNFGFNQMTDRFRDVRHSLFRKIDQQMRYYGTRAVELGQGGEKSMPLRYQDPSADFKHIFEQLLPGKVFLELRRHDQEILYEFDGSTLEFGTLSSGEREIVVTSFDFRLHNPSDSIVLFDEPELHLHPEMATRFLRTLQEIGDRNQFVLTTHSPDLISASLDDTVIFLQPPVEEGGGFKNQAVLASESEDAARALRALGQSLGVIALGRKIVLIEGDNGSLDKEVYSSILGSETGLVLLPAGSRDAITRFDRLHESIIEKSMWGIEFFAIRDRDITQPDDPSPRVATLDRYHLENYFLDERVWKTVFEEMVDSSDPLTSVAGIHDMLRQEMRATVGYAAALLVTRDARAAFGPFRLMPKGVGDLTPEQLKQEIEKRLNDEAERVSKALDARAIIKSLEHELERLGSSIERDTDEWKRDIPAREALHRFLAKTPLRTNVGAAKRLYLKRAADASEDPFTEIREIFRRFQEM